MLTTPTVRIDDLSAVERVLEAGAPAIQIRVKQRTDREVLELADAITSRCHAAGAMALVNDRVDLALAAGADGVHLGADDLPVAAARHLAGDRLLIGGTARNPDAAQLLVAAGADYLGVGPTFATRTKIGLPEPLGIARVAEVATAVEVPVIAISGVTAEHVPDLLAAGVHGVAVTDAVMGHPDPASATHDLLRAIDAQRKDHP